MRFTRQNKILSVTTACLLSNTLITPTEASLIWLSPMASILDSVYEVLFSDDTRTSRANANTRNLPLKEGREYKGYGTFDAYGPTWATCDKAGNCDQTKRGPEHREDFNWTMTEEEWSKMPYKQTADSIGQENTMAIFSEEYRDFYRVLGKASEVSGVIRQESSETMKMHRFGWNHVEEKNSKWFTHSDFTDADGNQNYYQLATRRPAISNRNDTHASAIQQLFGLSLYKEFNYCRDFPGCGKEDPRVLETGDCQCCNMLNKGIFQGCALRPVDSCSHVKYTDTNGAEKQARRWCPESLDESNEVYAYVQNDVDPKFLEGNIWADFWRLSKWDMLARWWVYNNFKGSLPVVMPDSKDAKTDEWDVSSYVRDDVSLGVHRVKYEMAANQNQMKRAHACYNGVESNAVSNYMWQPDPSDDATTGPTLDTNPDSPTMGHTLDWGSRDGARKGLLGEEVNYQYDVYLASMSSFYDGEEMCMTMGPQKKNDDNDLNNVTMQLRWTMKNCGKNQMHARPVCVIKGSDLSEESEIKKNAVDMKAGGPLFEKYMARSQQISDTYYWAGMWIAVPADTMYWFWKTYGFCFFFFCCCQMPCCWEGWICGKGGAVWESLVCFPCKIFCYGTLCGWRFREKVKKEEAADIIEKARLKKIKDEEEACSSDSSSSDSD